MTQILNHERVRIVTNNYIKIRRNRKERFIFFDDGTARSLRLALDSIRDLPPTLVSIFRVPNTRSRAVPRVIGAFDETDSIIESDSEDSE